MRWDNVESVIGHLIHDLECGEMWIAIQDELPDPWKLGALAVRWIQDSSKLDQLRALGKDVLVHCLTKLFQIPV